MPVRSLSSSVLRWPDRRAVDRAVREWALELAQARPDLRAAGYFGSYARGDWSVGSDVDLIVILASSPLPFERRAVGLDATMLPVPADLLVYTRHEWQHILQQSAGRRLAEEVVWVHGADPAVREQGEVNLSSKRGRGDCI
jgi:uncharacterized protein